MKNGIKKTICVLTVAILFGAFALTVCGCKKPVDENGNKNQGGDVVEVKFSLNLSYIVLEVGEKANLIALNYDGELTWESSNPSVCEVSGGALTAKAEGGAVITAKAGESSATCRVVVQNSGVVAVIELENPEVSILLGSSLNVGAKVTFKGKTVDATLTYKSEDVSIATVDGDGKVTGVSEGVTYVSVTDADRGLIETVRVTVRNY